MQTERTTLTQTEVLSRTGATHSLNFSLDECEDCKALSDTGLACFEHFTE